MIYVYCFLTVLCLISVAYFLVLRTKSANENSLVSKTFASFVFVTMGVISLIFGGNVNVKAMFVLGLVCGLIGDIILDLKIMHPEKNRTYLNTGMLMFGIGHVMYFLGIIIFIADKTVTGFWWMALSALLLSLLLGGLILKASPILKLDMTGFKWQSFLYSSLLIFMMLISICLSLAVPTVWFLGAGFTLFLASDLVLSLQYFGGKQDSKVLIVVNHVLYYVAQILIASFLFFI